MSGSTRQVMIDKIPTEFIPYEVGSVRIDSTGRVSVEPGEHAARFRFTLDGIRYSALARRRTEDGQLRLCGSVGVLPYSAQSSSARTAALGAVRDATAMNFGRFVVADDQNILFLADMAVPLPFTPCNLLTHLTLCLIELRPHVARVHEILEGMLTGGRGTAEAVEATA